MIIETKFSIGDVVWATFNGEVRGPLKIGRVRAEYTDSPGRPGEELFDNYKPQRGYCEEYMCIETGIGTGSVYKFERLHRLENDAQHAAKLEAFNADGG